MPHRIENTLTEVMNYAKSIGFGQLHCKIDAQTGLLAFIAIHNTKRGPALGGCRYLPYEDMAAGVKDALRLARGMSLKAVMAGIPYGGGKSVLIKPDQVPDREAYFKSFGRFVDEFNGRYITAIDSGTSRQDMDIIATQTPHVTSTSDHADPSFYTAYGVLVAMKAAVRFTFKRENLKGLHVAIQGTGHVGYLLAKDLYEEGAKLTVSDVSAVSAQRCAQEFGATIVSPEAIYSVECDVFAPCALGGILNEETLPQLKAKLVVGSANNQLADDAQGVALHRRGIVYVPDYLANAGGLICVVCEHEKKDLAINLSLVEKISQRTYDLLTRAQKIDRATSTLCDELALAELV